MLKQILVALDKVPYVDFPELKFSKHESTEMPFRYVTDAQGEPILPPVSNFSEQTAIIMTSADSLAMQGMKDLIQKDADKSVDDLF
jgi:hypothetical protein